MDTLKFAHPILLYVTLGVTLLLILWEVWKATKHQKKLQLFVAKKWIPKITRGINYRKIHLKTSLRIFALFLLGIALAQPQRGFEYREIPSKGIDIVFLLDASKSMLAEDIKPNRLFRSRLAMVDFVQALQGDRIGLVAFAGEAFLQCPLTLDYNAFLQSLESVNTYSIAVGGTDIAGALAEAEHAFSSENNYKILILITDGEELESSGVEYAKKASDRGVKIFSLGVGSASGELIPVVDSKGKKSFLRDSNGELVQSRLDAQTLQSIAEATGGFYSPLGTTGEGLQKIYDQGLGYIPRNEREDHLEKIPKEYYIYPTLLGLVFIILEKFIHTRKNV